MLLLADGKKNYNPLSGAICPVNSWDNIFAYPLINGSKKINFSAMANFE
jgi:hypothetical protein